MSEPAFEPAAATSLARSSELLGFGSGARLLIVNSDDFGIYPAVNTAVVESIELGIASSCSLMVPCPAAQQAMRLLGRKPGIDFGTPPHAHVRLGAQPLGAGGRKGTRAFAAR